MIRYPQKLNKEKKKRKSESKHETPNNAHQSLQVPHDCLHQLSLFVVTCLFINWYKVGTCYYLID